jgi:Rps23 Pro-64 3,4-dihydroxylase Tpa1-like proline 4-hydroxylase
MMTRSLERLRERADEFARAWSASTPFHYVVMDDVLEPADAEAILAGYPEPDEEGWNLKTFVHQRKKFTRTSGFAEPVADFFALTASPEFRKLMTRITGINDLVDDPELVGGGLHQIVRGGFLDVHVDYNFHPRTKLHRRLNLLVYMNKDWRDEYEGCLELWDMDKGRQLERIAPRFNRGVVFETNEISYHGHPRPLRTPQDMTRKSLAVYYYTATRDEASIAPEHNTLYRQTSGVGGYVKTSFSAAESAFERARTQGVGAVVRNIATKVDRTIKRKPPENF